MDQTQVNVVSIIVSILWVTFYFSSELGIQQGSLYSDSMHFTFGSVGSTT